MPRVSYAGTYDEQYQKERAPDPPLDFSYAFYNGAHPDLQVEGYLRGDEEVELTLELLGLTKVQRLELPTEQFDHHRVLLSSRRKGR